MSSLVTRLFEKALLGLEAPNAVRSLLSSSPEVARLLPFSHPIMETRQRSILDRNLQLSVTDQTSMSDDSNIKQPVFSWMRLRYPFKTSKDLRSQYSLPTGDLNLSLWLEDMDTFAADVAGRHCNILKGKTKLVTAALEHFIWWPTLYLQYQDSHALVSHDMDLSGQVTWVGKSSMEVTLELWSDYKVAETEASITKTSKHILGGSSKTSERVPVATARFLLAARTLDMSHAAPVATLQPDGEAERSRFDLGKQDQEKRHARRHQTSNHLITNEEKEYLASLKGIQQDIDMGSRGVSFGTGLKKEEKEKHLSVVKMHQTRLQSEVTTTFRDVNTTGSTFGGHLLRLGYEHGLRVAEAHAGSVCRLVTMSDVTFRLRVPIGVELQMRGVVAYVKGPLIWVHVSAWMASQGDPETSGSESNGETTSDQQGREKMTATSLLASAEAQSFWFAFQTESGHHPPSQVIPQNEEETDLFLTAYRQHLADK